MSTAIVNAEGAIDFVVAKVSPMYRHSVNTRFLPYNPPMYDAELFVLLPDVPVPPSAQEVTFTLTPKANHDTILVARQLAQIDKDVDLIYAQAIGNRGPEYTEAEAQAKAFANAGYTGEAPFYVSCWAEAKAWTNTEAADDILAQSVAWRTAAAQLRAQRLAAKEAVRNGNGAIAVPLWDAFVSQIRAALGLPSPTP